MFTIQQIKEAHSEVRSGADFLKYIKGIIELGVTSYETFVSNSHTDYFGKDGFKALSEGLPETLSIIDESHVDQFKTDLKAHQQGQTDFSKFRKDSAKSGIKKWKVVMDKKTCSYFDEKGNEILVETIPV